MKETKEVDSAFINDLSEKTTGLVSDNVTDVYTILL